MKDNLSIVILMIMFVTLVVMFPLYNFFERQDDMSYNLALKATTIFVDKVINNGYLDTETYSDFVLDLANTGNIYDIEIEAHRQIITKDPKYPDKEIYVTQYKVDYTDDIFSALAPTNDSATLINREVKNSIYNMEIGDGFYVKLKNSNTTMAGALFNSIITTSSPERIVVNYGGTVKNEAWRLIDATFAAKDSSLVVQNFESNKANESLADSSNAGMYVNITTSKQEYVDESGNLILSFDSNLYDEIKCDGEFQQIDEYEILVHSCYLSIKDCGDNKVIKKCPLSYQNENCNYTQIGEGNICPVCGKKTLNVRFRLTCKFCSHQEDYVYKKCLNCETKNYGKTIDSINFVMGYHESEFCLLDKTNDIYRKVKVFKCNKCNAMYKEYTEVNEVCSICKTKVNSARFVEGTGKHNIIIEVK